MYTCVSMGKNEHAAARRDIARGSTCDCFGLPASCGSYEVASPGAKQRLELLHQPNFGGRLA